MKWAIRIRARRLSAWLALALAAVAIAAGAASAQGRDAGPRERRARREAMRGLVRALPDARPVERLAIVREAMHLPFAERRALRDRLRRIDELAPDERRDLVVELEGLRDRAGPDIERLERNLDRWEKLSETDRERYRAQMQRLRDMPIEERQRLLDEWERAGKGEREGGDDGRDSPPKDAAERESEAGPAPNAD